jgi:hypothetical protein
MDFRVEQSIREDDGPGKMGGCTHPFQMPRGLVPNKSESPPSLLTILAIHTAVLR